jgi:hypothetical protein
MVSARPDRYSLEEVSMLTSLGNNKRTDQDSEELRLLGLFAITTVVLLAIAGYVGLVF